jgi:3-phosphoshikimate 1-carboxyvinyltransferase
MVLGSLTGSDFTLRNPLISEDTKATLDSITALGGEVRAGQGEVMIRCEQLRPAVGVIDARNSGTTIRIITGIASLLPSATTLTGDASLVRRPMGPLVDALTQLGAKCTYIGHPGHPPLRITGPISGQRTHIPGGVSSQFISSLLIACSQKKGETSIEIDGEVTSKPYVDITLEILRDFGGEALATTEGFTVPGEQSLKQDSYVVPGDFSSAAFPLSAAAITGGDVTVRNLARGSPQGDKAIVDHLRAFGAKAIVTEGSVRVIGGHLKGVNVNVQSTPDLFPILAVVGAVADGTTVLHGGGNLRAKESDRIATTTALLEAMGARVHPRPDGCEIIGGGKLHGATVATQGDHRILMAAAVAALVSSSETRIEDEASYGVSYPGFLRDMHQLGCRMEVKK